jgi:hypothetical protein
MKILDDAKEIISERGSDYGGFVESFNRASAIASTLSGKDITPYDVAVVMMAVKQARINNDPMKYDSWVDLIAYCGFASYFASPSQRKGKVTAEEVEFIMGKLRD